MDTTPPGTGDAESQLAVSAPSPTPAERAAALIEVLLCSDYPTQIALGATFAALGFSPQSGDGLSLGYVAGISLLDSILLTALLIFFLRMRGESPAEVFFGGRPIGAEARAGVPLLFVAF